MRVWGEVQAPSGERVTARVQVANGYDVTTHAALAVAQRLLEGPPVAPVIARRRS